MDICELAVREAIVEKNDFYDRRHVIKLLWRVLRSKNTEIAHIVAYHKDAPCGIASIAAAPPLPGLPYKSGFTLVYYVRPQERYSAAAAALMKGMAQWCMNRNLAEIHIHATSGIKVPRSHKMFKKMNFYAYGANYSTTLPLKAMPQTSSDPSVKVQIIQGQTELGFLRPIFQQVHFHQVHKENASINQQTIIDNVIKQSEKLLKIDPQRAFLLAQRDGKPVGFAGIACVPTLGAPHYIVCHAEHFYTLPEEASGTAEIEMVRAMSQWSQAKGASKILLFMFAGERIPSIGENLQRVGFRLVGMNYVRPLKKNENL